MECLTKLLQPLDLYVKKEDFKTEIPKQWNTGWVKSYILLWKAGKFIVLYEEVTKYSYSLEIKISSIIAGFKEAEIQTSENELSNAVEENHDNMEEDNDINLDSSMLCKWGLIKPFLWWFSLK